MALSKWPKESPSSWPRLSLAAKPLLLATPTSTTASFQTLGWEPLFYWSKADRQLILQPTGNEPLRLALSTGRLEESQSRPRKSWLRAENRDKYEATNDAGSEQKTRNRFSWLGAFSGFFSQAIRCERFCCCCWSWLLWFLLLLCWVLDCITRSVGLREVVAICLFFAQRFLFCNCRRVAWVAFWILLLLLLPMLLLHRQLQYVAAVGVAAIVSATAVGL